MFCQVALTHCPVHNVFLLCIVSMVHKVGLSDGVMIVCVSIPLRLAV